MSTLKVNNIESFSSQPTVHFNDGLAITGSIFISGNITPYQDDHSDLGSSTKQWKDLYVDGIAYIDSANIGSGSFTTELKVTGSRVDFNNLPTTDPGVSGRLYQQSGSQLGFTGDTSASLFVLISA